MKSYSLLTRFGVTAAAFATLSIILFVGCEGESRKRSSDKANLPDSSAARKADPPKPENVSSTTSSSVATNNSATSNEPPNSTDSAITSTQPETVVEKPVPAKVDITKLEEVRKRLGYHSAMVTPSEVNVVANAGAQENRNMIYRAAEGLEFDRLRKAMDAYKALNNGKVPKDVPAFIKFLRDDENRIYLPELKPDQFYIYDPEAAKLEKGKENLDYLKVYEP